MFGIHRIRGYFKSGESQKEEKPETKPPPRRSPPSKTSPAPKSPTPSNKNKSPSKSPAPANRAKRQAPNNASGLADESGEVVSMEVLLANSSPSGTIVESVETDGGPPTGSKATKSKPAQGCSTTPEAPKNPRSSPKPSIRKTRTTPSPVSRMAKSTSPATPRSAYKTPPTELETRKSKTPSAHGANKTWSPGKSVRFSAETSSKSSRVLKSPTAPRRSNRIRKPPPPYTGEVPTFHVAPQNAAKTPAKKPAKRTSKKTKFADRTYQDKEDDDTPEPSPTLPKKPKRVAPTDPNATFKPGPEPESPNSSTTPRKSRKRTAGTTAGKGATARVEDEQPSGRRRKTPAKEAKTAKTATASLNAQEPGKRGRPKKDSKPSKAAASSAGNKPVNGAATKGAADKEKTTVSEAKETKKQRTAKSNSPSNALFVPREERNSASKVMPQKPPPSVLQPRAASGQIPTTPAEQRPAPPSHNLRVPANSRQGQSSKPIVNAGPISEDEDEDEDNPFERHYRETGEELTVKLKGLDIATRAKFLKQAYIRRQKKLASEGKFERSSTPSPEPGLTRKNWKNPAAKR